MLIIVNSIIFVRWVYRFHEIHGANLCAFPHYSVEVCKELPELVETVYSSRRTSHALYLVVYRGGGHVLAYRLVLRDGKTEAEILLGGRQQLILAVVIDNLLVFIVVKPIALAIHYGMHRLGVELLVVDGLIDDYGSGEFDADESAAA